VTHISLHARRRPQESEARARAEAEQHGQQAVALGAQAAEERRRAEALSAEVVGPMHKSGAHRLCCAQPLGGGAPIGAPHSVGAPQATLDGCRQC
jgi:hypothetical protein